MFEIIKDTLIILPITFRRKLIIFQFLLMMVAAIEVVGVASIGPFIGIALDENYINNSQLLLKINYLLGSPSKIKFLTILGVVFCSIVCFANALILYVKVKTINLTSDLTSKLSTTLFKAYMVDASDVYKNLPKAQLSTRLNSDVNKVCNNVILSFLQINASLISVIVLVSLIFYVNVYAAVLISSTFIISYSLIFYAVNQKLKKNGWDITQLNREKANVTYEAFQSYPTVVLYQLYDYFTSRLMVIYREDKLLKAKEKIYQDAPYYVIDTITFVSIVLIVLVLVQLENSSEKMLASVSVIGLAGYRIIPKLQSLYRSLVKIKKNQTVLKELKNSLISNQKTSETSPILFYEGGATSLLKLTDISFSYGCEKLLFENLNFELNQGEFVGLKGASGEGKSSLVKIMLGHITPNSGSVSITLPETAKNTHISTISLVEANMYIFSTSILNNITLFQKSTDEKMQTALKVSGFGKVMQQLNLSLFDTVGETGFGLSSGQCQKLAFARALYHECDFLLLDEATNALDENSQQKLLQGIRQYFPELGVLMISHRPDFIQYMDKMYTLESGCLSVVSL